jgi:hypothetical protein
MKLNTLQLSRKRLMISNANSIMLAAVALTSATVVFSGFASKGLYKQSSFQKRVITERKKSLKQLQDNVSSAKSLVESYRAFDANKESFLANADNNTRLTLDALPSKYDFPALTASVEKILTAGGYPVEAISGIDNETTAQQDSPKPVATAQPFSVTTRGTYGSIQKLIKDFERSIRPIKIKKIELAGSDASVRAIIDADTYYQPEKKLEIQTKVVK